MRYLILSNKLYICWIGQSIFVVVERYLQIREILAPVPILPSFQTRLTIGRRSNQCRREHKQRQNPSHRFEFPSVTSYSIDITFYINYQGRVEYHRRCWGKIFDGETPAVKNRYSLIYYYNVPRMCITYSLIVCWRHVRSPDNRTFTIARFERLLFRSQCSNS